MQLRYQTPLFDYRVFRLVSVRLIQKARDFLAARLQKQALFEHIDKPHYSVDPRYAISQKPDGLRVYTP